MTSVFLQASQQHEEQTGSQNMAAVSFGEILPKLLFFL
jgi:hypothetical protein